MSDWSVLQLPYPPSVNKAFRNLSGGGRARTGGYSKWRRAAGLEIMAQRPPRLKCAYELHIIAGKPDNRRRDIDNLIKPISDALVNSGVVIDDSDCVRVTAEWTKKTGRNVTVRIRPFTEDNP